MLFRGLYSVVVLIDSVLGAYDDVIIANTESACKGVSVPSVNITTTNYTGYDAYVGTNVLQKMLYDPNCIDANCILNYMSDLITGALSASVGIFLALFTLLVFLGLLPCLCSRNVRQWRGWKLLSEYKTPHGMNPRGVRFVWVLFAVIAMGTLADMILISRNDATMKTKLDESFCELFMFMNETINGGSAVIFIDSYGYLVEAQFPGLASVADLLTNLTDLVAPNSTLQNELSDLVNITAPIEQAFVNLTSSFSTLNDVMKANYIEGYHSLVFGSNFSYYQHDYFYNHPNNPSMTNVNNSFGSIVQQMRTDYFIPLTSDAEDSLYSLLSDITDSLNNFVDNLDQFVNDSLLGNMNSIKSIFNYFYVSVIVFVVLAAGPLYGGFWALSTGLSKDRKIKPSIWPFMGTCTFTFLVFLLSGILLLMAYSTASVCLVFEDVGSVAQKISFRFSSSSTIADSVASITQECLRQTTDGDILSGIIVNGDSNARTKIDTITTLSGEYDTLHNAAINGVENTHLAVDPHLVHMKNFLQSVGNLYLISNWTANTLVNYQPFAMPSDPKEQEIWHYAINSAAQCPNRVVSLSNTPEGVLDWISDYTSSKNSTDWTIPGITSIIAKYKANGINTGIDQCPSPHYATGDIVPWGNIESMKLGMVQTAQYRCDVSGVVQSENGAYVQNSTQKFCSFDQFAIYMQNFGTQIINQATVLDAEVDSQFTTIMDTVWDLIYNELLEPIMQIGEDLNCQFISARWNGLMNSMCGGFTPNLINLAQTFFALGFMGLFLMAIQFLVWRHRTDNYCLLSDMQRGVGPYAHFARVSTYSPARIAHPVGGIEEAQANQPPATTISQVMDGLDEEVKTDN